jgi:septum formation inhibitor MinC
MQSIMLNKVEEGKEDFDNIKQMMNQKIQEMRRTTLQPDVLLSVIEESPLQNLLLHQYYLDSPTMSPSKLAKNKGSKYPPLIKEKNQKIKLINMTI